MFRLSSTSKEAPIRSYLSWRTNPCASPPRKNNREWEDGYSLGMYVIRSRWWFFSTLLQFENVRKSNVSWSGKEESSCEWTSHLFLYVDSSYQNLNDGWTKWEELKEIYSPWHWKKSIYILRKFNCAARKKVTESDSCLSTMFGLSRDNPLPHPLPQSQLHSITWTGIKFLLLLQLAERF